jgi:hypothetical protein
MSPEPKREVEAQYRALLDEARGRLQVRVNFAEMTRLGVYATPMGPGSVAEYESELRAEVAYYFPLLRDDVAKMSAKQYGLLICGGAERTRPGRSGWRGDWRSERSRFTLKAAMVLRDNAVI